MKAHFQRRRTRERERGDIMPAAIAAVFLLLFALCAVIDPSCALFSKVQQENALATAKEACMQPAFALMQKNSPAPGLVVGSKIVGSLRESGFDGRIDVYYYEAPESATGPAKRLYVVGIQLQEDFETIVSRGVGVESLPVASHTVFSAVPYSEERAWRPAKTFAGIQTSSAPGATISRVETADLDAFPQEMIDEAKSQLERIE